MRKRWCDIQRERIENDAPRGWGRERWWREMRGSAGVSVAAASHWLGGQNQERTAPASLLPRPTLACLSLVVPPAPTHLLRPHTGLAGVSLRQACGGGDTYLPRSTVVQSSRVPSRLESEFPSELDVIRVVECRRVLASRCVPLRSRRAAPRQNRKLLQS